MLNVGSITSVELYAMPIGWRGYITQSCWPTGRGYVLTAHAHVTMEDEMTVTVLLDFEGSHRQIAVRASMMYEDIGSELVKMTE